MDSEAQARYALNGKVMLASTVFLFLIILLIIFLHTYCHSCFRRRRRHSHRRRILVNNSTATFNESLHPSVLNFLPTFTCSSNTHRPHHDCAVCLSEFADGDKGRILPNCNHAFHSHCIDAWFRSHSNCPLCRTPVKPVQLASSSIEPGPVGLTLSSFPAPIGCPRKSLELVGIIVEMEDTKRLGSGSHAPHIAGSEGRII